MPAAPSMPPLPLPQHHYVLAFTTLLAVGYVSIALFRHTVPVQRLVRLGGDWPAAVVPRFLAIVTFLAGALLLFSGATPAAASKLAWLAAWIPLPIVELSHFLDNLAGVSLLILARGVERRLDAAYHLTIAMLVTGILLSILRALDIEQAIVLALMLVTFIPSRKYFYRRSSLIEERFSAQWILAILLVVFGSIALGIVSYANLRVSTETFFRFGTRAEESRFLRATAGVLAALVIFAALRLLRPARPIIPSPTADETDAARAIAAQYPGAAAQLAFLGDKYFFFDEKRTGFIMYAVNGRSWVSLGDPVAPVSSAAGLIREWTAMVDRNGGWPVFYKVAPTLLYLYLDHGLSVVKLGEEARVSLAEFSLEGSNRRNLRRVWRKIVDEGCTFEVVQPDALGAIMPELRAISDQWMQQKHAREKAFSLGFFEEAYVSRYPVALARKEGRIVAFSNAWVSGRHEEIEADLMRYTDDAPPGIMRYLLVEMMLWGKSEGFHWFNLGMASLSGLSVHSRAPIWNQIAVTVRGYGEKFYNFQGIREFKQWFYPEWEPRFLVSPGGALRPVVLANIASLVAGGLEGVVKK
ncbi:MAG: phosphatidylglycerol lysyltransferase domain-containing protein [Gemmatimonadaceae bacterium]